MGPKTAELVALLNQAAEMLRRTDNEHWAAWLERDARELRAGDFHGVEHFLGAFGGMGSLNDISYGSQEELPGLLSRAYAIATDVRHEHLRAGGS